MARLLVDNEGVVVEQCGGECGQVGALDEAHLGETVVDKGGNIVILCYRSVVPEM